MTDDLEKSSFKKWLVKQPASREFEFTDPDGCLIASWLKEEVKLESPLCGAGHFSHIIGRGFLREDLDYPAWLQQVHDVAISLDRHFTIKDFREVYRV